MDDNGRAGGGPCSQTLFYLIRLIRLQRLEWLHGDPFC
jgi:hypothetical protein